MPAETLVALIVAVVFLVLGAVLRSRELQSLRGHIGELRIAVTQREQHLESLSRTHKQQIDALLAKLDVHQDDGGKCRTIPRDRKHVAELLRQRKARDDKTEKEWGQVNEEQGLTGVEVATP